MESNFVFCIEKVLSIPDEVVVTGRIKLGEVKKGEEVHLVNRAREFKNVTCKRLEKDCHEIVRARVGQNIVISLSGVEAQDIEIGMCLATPGYMVRF